MKRFTILTLVLISLISGCATAVYGSKQSVLFDSIQPGTKVVVYDSALYGIKSEYIGTLPANIDLYRKKFYKIDFINPKYQQKTLVVKADYNFGDALSNLFVVTMAIDTFTGASRSFPEKITIDFSKDTKE